MIDLQNVSRWYGDVIGLNDVTCSIGSGVTALLGQNGAGKSTLMKLITGQIRPTTGEIKVFGQDPFANPAVFEKIGLCPDIDSFPEHLSGREFVYRMGRMMGYDHQEGVRRTDEVLQMVGMAERAEKPLKGYSKGMRQRIKLAQAVFHDPDLLLLDEPLNGLDPVGRREFMDVLSSLAARGKAIVVSSHILFEVEQMTRSILLLHRGRLLASGDVSEIRDLIDRYPHRIRIRGTQIREIAGRFAALPYVVSVRVDDKAQEMEVETRQAADFYATVSDLASQGFEIYEMESPDNNLESVYEYLVGTS
jgi:ABC-2 type transport system ATP-binding protein